MVFEHLRAQFDEFRAGLAYGGLQHQHALEKSKALLLHLLNSEQRRQIEHGWFLVKVKRWWGGKRTYMILTDKGTSHNVIDLKTGHSYCAYPRGSFWMPLYDVLLTQKLVLESNPRAFFRVAYKSLDPAVWT